MYKAKVGRGANFDFDESSEYRDAYTNLNKSDLVQKTSIFNDKKLRDSECTDLHNKIIYLLNQVSDTLHYESILTRAFTLLIGTRLCRHGEKLNVLQCDKAFPDGTIIALESSPLDLRVHQGAQGQRERGLHCHLLPQQGYLAVRQRHGQGKCAQSSHQDY